MEKTHSLKHYWNRSVSVVLLLFFILLELRHGGYIFITIYWINLLKTHTFRLFSNLSLTIFNLIGP